MKLLGDIPTYKTGNLPSLLEFATSLGCREAVVLFVSRGFVVVLKGSQ